MRGMGFGAGYGPRRAAAGGGGASDPDFASVVFLSNFGDTDGATAFSDDSNSNHALTAVGTAQTDTAVTIFGEPTLLLDGGGSVSIPDSDDWHFGTGDFTIELFHNKSISDAGCYIAQFGASGTRGWVFEQAASALQFLGSANGSSFTNIVSTSPYSSPLNQTVHLVAERSGNTFRLYQNGTMLVKATNTINLVNTASILEIGAYLNGSTRMEAALLDVRITKGVARYASDAGYTVPAAAFPRS